VFEEFFRQVTNFEMTPVEALKNFLEFHNPFYGIEVDLLFDDRLLFLKFFNEMKWSAGESKVAMKGKEVGDNLKVGKDGRADFNNEGKRLLGSLKQYMDITEEKSREARTPSLYI
jgi:hypothetical protein